MTYTYVVAKKTLKRQSETLRELPNLVKVKLISLTLNFTSRVNILAKSDPPARGDG